MGRTLCNIPTMKLAWIAAALLATVGCEKAPSRLDKITSTSGAESGAGAASGDLEARVARLEKKLSKVDQGAIDLLVAAYQQREQQREEAETRAQPGVVYGVDIQPNIQLGMVEGSPEALVTIVEAWDFA
jgi:surface antigen